jgi:hypothetical protein
MAMGNPHTNVRSFRDGSPLTGPQYHDSVRKSELTEQARFSSQVFVASIVEVNQQLGCYRLRASGTGDMVGVPLCYPGAALDAGVRSIAMHGVGVRVLAMATGETGTGQAIVLGRIPEFTGDGQPIGSSELTPGSPVGSFKDVISDEGMLNRSLYNYNNGHDVDVYPGDYQTLNVLGCGLVVGALHASLISGYGCSVECHYIDDLLRLSSYNFEQSTAGSETLMFADGGDYTEVRRLNPYVLESMGAPYQYGDLPMDNGKPRGPDAKGEDDTGVYKDKVEEQQGWWRKLDFSGHLANLSATYVAVPDLNEVRSSAKVEQQDERGVFREHLDATGAYSVVSAKSISFIKDCFIPVPRERYRPDNSKGAKAETLQADRESLLPELADMTIEGTEEDQDGSSLLYPAAGSDSVAFRTHRASVNFKGRKDDWTIWDIEEVDLGGLKSQVQASGMLPPSENIRAGRMHANLPKVATLRISEGQDARYYASRSMVLMNDDGSIHVQDGYGSMISMRAGSIDISCPGDITLRPGRNLAVIAGDSVSCVAGVDVELAANQGDVRVHADRNFSVLSGNDGAGGILMETKASGSVLSGQNEAGAPKFKDPKTNSNAYGGIWFKARNSSVCTVAKEIYGGNGTNASTIRLDCSVGDITLAGSLAVIGTKSTVAVTNLEQPASGTALYLTDSGSYLTSPGSFILDGSTLLAQANLQVKGAGFFSESLVTAKSLSSGTGGIPGQIAATSVNPIVSAMNKAINDSKNNLFNISGAPLKLTTAANKEFTKSVLGAVESSLSKLTFCYPDSALRGIADEATYVLLEGDWQQQYRLRGSGSAMTLRGVDPNSESGPASPGVTDSLSYFWPGAQALSGKLGKLAGSDGRFVDDKLRLKAEGFDAPVAPVEAATTFEGNYFIPVRNQVRSIQ